MAVRKKISKSVSLGVLSYKNKIGLLERSIKKSSSFNFSWSEDGVNFEPDQSKVFFRDGLKNHKSEQCSNFRFSNFGRKVLASYTRIEKENKYRVIAESKDIYNWEVVSETLSDGHESVIVPEINFKSKYIMYEGGTFIQYDNILLFTSRENKFDRDDIRLIGSIVTKEGIVLLYDAKEKKGNAYTLCLGGVLLDPENPSRLVRRMNAPLWRNDVNFEKDSDCTPLGVISHKDSIYIFWANENYSIVVCLNDLKSITHIFKPEGLHLKKHKKNPIMKPPEKRSDKNSWKHEAIFNPAALYDDGKFHILYRAIGSDGISRIGYDSSEDGINFKDASDHPAFVMQKPSKNSSSILKRFDPFMYPSGGSWGGAEDPRMVKIGRRIYVTFNAFDGWDFVRVCVISIDEKDFRNKNWKWSVPLLISTPNQINKNWVLFPEKINGKFAILHNIWPKIGIEYVDSLESLALGKHKVPKYWDIGRGNMPKNWVLMHDGTPGARFVDPKYLEQNVWQNTGASNNWDTWIRSAGPPPIKTSKGWLILYHAMDENEAHIGYKLGAMLVELDDPEKVIGRSKTAILSPEAWYENEWKFGVVYACGAVVKDDTLFVYYGGGDKHVCVATISLAQLLEKLINN